MLASKLDWRRQVRRCAGLLNGEISTVCYALHFLQAEKEAAKEAEKERVKMEKEAEKERLKVGGAQRESGAARSGCVGWESSRSYPHRLRAALCPAALPRLRRRPRRSGQKLRKRRSERRPRWAQPQYRQYRCRRDVSVGLTGLCAWACRRSGRLRRSANTRKQR